MHTLINDARTVLNPQANTYPQVKVDYVRTLLEPMVDSSPYFINEARTLVESLLAVSWVGRSGHPQTSDLCELANFKGLDLVRQAEDNLATGNLYGVPDTEVAEAIDYLLNSYGSRWTLRYDHTSGVRYVINSISEVNK